MKKKLKSLFLKLTPPVLREIFFYSHPEYKKLKNGYVSFSQEGEDMVLRRIFCNKSQGRYVDIGAHHPSLYSNTNYFYQRGWSGINIDGLPASKIQFDIERPGDVNLELLVAEREGLVEFHLFEPRLMSTMSAEQVEENKKFEWCKFKETLLVPCMPLSKVLNQYLRPADKIDFMTIDVEGSELTVLKSNDWEKYLPDVLLVEFIDIDLEDIFKTDVHKYLTSLSYKFFSKTWNTAFYKQVGFFEFR